MRNLASSIVSPRPNTLGTKLTLKTVALATNQLKDAEVSLKRVRRKTEDLLVDSQFMLFLLILVYSHYSWRRILKVGVDRKVNTHHYSDETVYCRTPAVSVPQFTRRKTWKYSLYIDLFCKKVGNFDKHFVSSALLLYPWCRLILTVPTPEEIFVHASDIITAM